MGSWTADLYLIKADPEVLGSQTRPKVHLSTTQPCGCPHVDPDLNPIQQISGEKNLFTMVVELGAGVCNLLLVLSIRAM